MTDDILTGVHTINKTAWLYEDIIYRSINLTYEEALKDLIESGVEEGSAEYEEFIEFYEDDSADTRIIGFVLNEDTGLYEPDINAEYSAIISEVYAQVVRSKWYTLGAYCSPCFPGQCDVETAGTVKGYCLPASMYEENECPFEAIPIN